KLAHGSRDAVPFQLLLQNKDDAFAGCACRGNFKLKTERNLLAVDHLIENAVSISICPAGCFQQLKCLLWIVRIVMQSLIVLRTKKINRPIDDLAQAKQNRFGDLLPIHKVCHRLGYSFATENEAFFVPAYIGITRGEVLQFLKLTLESLATSAPRMLYGRQIHHIQSAALERYQGGIRIGDDPVAQAIQKTWIDSRFANTPVFWIALQFDDPTGFPFSEFIGPATHRVAVVISVEIIREALDAFRQFRRVF